MIDQKENSSNGPNEFVKLLTLGEIALKASNSVDANRYFTSATEAAPEDWRGWFGKGRATLIDASKPIYERAQSSTQYFDAAISLSPAADTPILCGHELWRVASDIMNFTPYYTQVQGPDMYYQQLDLWLGVSMILNAAIKYLPHEQSLVSQALDTTRLIIRGSWWVPPDYIAGKKALRPDSQTMAALVQKEAHLARILSELQKQEGVKDSPALNSEKKGYGSSCFVATLAYGSSEHWKVQTLRRWRDEHLLKNPFGERIVRQYYLHSPRCCMFLSNSRWLTRIVTFVVVEPCVLIARICQKSSFFGR